MIESDRIYLKPLELGDEVLLFELDSNPKVTKYVGGKRYTISEYKESVDKLLNPEWINNDCGYYKAFLKDTNEFIGWFHLRPEVSEPRNYRLLELGYRLKEEYWNKGYATEMSKVLISKAFNVNKCDIVSAITMKENMASRKVMEKCQMAYNDKLIYYGLDCVRYIIDKDMFYNN